MGQMFKLTTPERCVIASKFHYADNQVDLNGNKMSLQEFIGQFAMLAPRRKTVNWRTKRNLASGTGAVIA